MLPVTTIDFSSVGPTYSSNQVLWPGPDIQCINLCKGDTISKAIAEIASKLCSISNAGVDISSLDLKCLIGVEDPAPETIQEVIQKIIDKICESVPVIPGTEEPVLDLPECVQYQDGEGSTVTQLPLSDFALHLANEICAIMQEFVEINNALNNHEQRITALENRVDPETGIPNITSACISSDTPGSTVPVTDAVQNLEAYLCDLKNTLGENTELAAGAAAQCANLDSTPSLSNPGVTMSSIPGWTVNPSTVADSLHNLWLTVCDIRQKLENC